MDDNNNIFSYLTPFKIDYYDEKKIPSLNSPYLLCGFPGSGFVGKLAVDHMIKELDAKPFADIYFTAFPSQVSIKEDGTLNLIRNSIYYFKHQKRKSGKTNDLLLLTGDAQPIEPSSEYILVEKILEILQPMKINKIFSLASYVTGSFSDKIKIFGTATDIKIVETFRNYDISFLDRGNISGMNGLIIGISKLKGINGICLLGETSGYVIDAKSALSLLERLLKILDITINLDVLEKRAKDTEILIKNIQQQINSTQSTRKLGNVMDDEGNIGLYQTDKQRSNTGYIS